METPGWLEAWVRGLEGTPRKDFLALWTLWEATSETVLLWPDEVAQAIWVADSGLLEARRATGSAWQALSPGRPTPVRWLGSASPCGFLIRARKGARFWSLAAKDLLDFGRRHPQALRYLRRAGGPLQDLCDLPLPAPETSIGSPLRVHAASSLLLLWLVAPLAFLALGLGLLAGQLAGGWLGVVLGVGWSLERLFHWWGEYLELGAEELTYVRLDLWGRRFRRWRARWADVQGVESTQIGWLERFLGFYQLTVHTRHGRESLRLRRFGKNALRALSNRRPAAEDPLPANGLRQTWELLHGNGRAPIRLWPPTHPPKGPSPSSEARVVFARHPLTWLYRTALAWTALGGAVLAVGLGLMGGILPLAALGLTAAVWGLVRLIWEWWDWLNDTYALEGTTLVDEERRPLWLGVVRREIPLLSLQSVEVVQEGLAPILFDWGTLRLTGTGGSTALEWKDLASPAVVQRRVEDLQRSVRVQHQEQERQQRFLELSGALVAWERFRDWGLISPQYGSGSG